MEYPAKFRAIHSGDVVEFTALNTGTVISTSRQREDNRQVGIRLTNLISHTDTNVWKQIVEPTVQDEISELKSQLLGLTKRLEEISSPPVVVNVNFAPTAKGHWWITKDKCLSNSAFDYDNRLYGLEYTSEEHASRSLTRILKLDRGMDYLNHKLPNLIGSNEFKAHYYDDTIELMVIEAKLSMLLSENGTKGSL